VPVHQVCQNLTPPDWPTARLTPAHAHRAGLPERHNRATSRPALRARRSPASVSRTGGICKADRALGGSTRMPPPPRSSLCRAAGAWEYH
jgi:hypothetical protein